MVKQIKTKSGDKPVTNRDQSLELVANCDQLRESTSQVNNSQTDIEHLILLLFFLAIKRHYTKALIACGCRQTKDAYLILCPTQHLLRK